MAITPPNDFNLSQNIFGQKDEDHEKLSSSSTQVAKDYFLANLDQQKYGYNPMFNLEARRFQVGDKLFHAPTKKMLDSVKSALQPILSSPKIIDSSEMTTDLNQSEANAKNLKDIQEQLDDLDENALIEPERRTLMIGEILSKGFSYCIIENLNFVLNIPQLIDGEWKKVPFKVLPWDLGDNNLAYILEPIEPLGKVAPIVLIRGTDPFFIRGTLHTSLGIRSVYNFLKDGSLNFGGTVLKMNQAKFSEVLTELSEKHGVKPTVMGHSLGGTLAQRFALQEGNLEKISSVMAFNSPGITHSELQVWEKHLEQKPEDRSKAIVVNTSDDFVNPLAKKRFIGRKFLFTPTEQFKKIHGKTLLGRAGRLEEVSLEESFSSLKKTSEKVQRIAKNIIKFIAYRFVTRVLTTFVLVVIAAILEICFYFGHTKDSFNKSRLSRQKEIESDTSLNRLEKIRKHQESCLTSRIEYVKLLQNVEDLLHLIHSQTTTV